MEKKELKVGSDVITSKGLFGKVTAIKGDVAFVKLGAKEFPIFIRQLTVSESTTAFHVTYKVKGDDTEYIIPVVLGKYTIVCDDNTDFKSLCINQIFNRTGKKCTSIVVSIA